MSIKTGAGGTLPLLPPLLLFLLIRLFCVIKQPTCEQHFTQARRNTQLYFKACSLGFVIYNEDFPAFHVFTHTGNLQYIALVDLIVIRFVYKGERQNSVVDEVCHVDTCKALCDNGFNAKIQRRKRGVLS